MAPVSTSPMPAVAIPGFPVGFTVACPSGEAVTVGAPLSTTTERQRCAHSRAASMRRASRAGTATPVSRAISPKCGVSTRAPGPRVSGSGFPAKAFRPSASMTSGRSHSATTRRASSAASRCRDRPEPRATTSAAAACASSGSRAASASVRSAVSGLGSVISSVSFTSSTSLRLLGTAACT